jgi:energy-coupling factor transport system permease protein
MMLRNISLGVYYPGSSPLHRLQARTKLLLLIGIIMWLILASHNLWHFAPYIAVVALICLSAILSGISLRELGRRMSILVALAIIGVLSGLFRLPEPGDKLLATIGPLVTTYALAHTIALIGVAVLLAFVLSSLLPLLPLRALWRRGWLSGLRVMMVVAILALLVFLWLTGGEAPAQRFTLGPLIITYQNAWLQITVFIALLALYALSMLLTMTTTPVALIEGLTMLLSPLRRLKLPVDDFALMALLALRFIPTLIEEMEQLFKAQSARGANLMSGTLRERFQSLTGLFVPLMQGAFRRASELATALEARGYEVEGQQTFLHETGLRAQDYIALAAVVCLIVGTLVL